jgi:hypothetical protein
LRTISPLMRPSLPITIFLEWVTVSFIHDPNAAENFTISRGVRFSLGLPPIVPLMPEMLLINATKDEV